MVAHLDITLASLVSRELKAMSERMKEKYWEEKEKYWNMLEKKENKNEEVEDKEKQEDSKDKVEEENGKEESPSKSAEGHKEEVSPEETGNKEEVESSEMNPKTSKEAEGKDWQQMLRLVMLLQNEGNFLIKEKNFQDASVKFKEAVEYVDVLRNMVSVIDFVVIQKSQCSVFLSNKTFCEDRDCPDGHSD